MDWLSQNWLWVVLTIGVVWYILRTSGVHRPGGLGHPGHSMSAGCGHGDYHDHRQGPEQTGQPGYRPSQADIPGAAIDPVSGAEVGISKAFTSVYRGRTYYFVSRENRERFEADPERYASIQDTPGSATQEVPPSNRHHRRHGC